MLTLIWSVALVLALCALAVMAVLVVRRLVLERRDAGAVEARRGLHSALIRFSQAPDRPAILARIAATPLQIVTDAGFELLSLMRGEDRARIEAVFDEAGVPAHVRDRLRRANEAHRIQACEVLVAFASPETIAALEAALAGDRSREVRLAASIALARLGALPPLDVVLGRIGYRGQRSKRLIELFQQVPADSLAELRGLAGAPQAIAFVRAAALDALSNTGDYALLPLLDRCAVDASPEVAAAAMRALGRLGHPASAATVLGGLGSPDWQVRFEAAEAAGRIGIAAAIAPLDRLLDDPDWTVRFEAGKSLGALGPKGREALAETAGGPVSRRQRTASLILADAQG